MYFLATYVHLPRFRDLICLNCWNRQWLERSFVNGFNSCYSKSFLLGSLSFRICPLVRNLYKKNGALSFNSNLNHLPQKILPNSAFWCLSSRFLVTCGYYELKLFTKPFKSRGIRDVLIQIQNISLRSSGSCAESKMWIKNFQSFFSLLFSLLPIFFRSFYPLFSFAGQVVGSISVGKVFEKVFRILGVWRNEVQVPVVDLYGSALRVL